MGSYHLGRKVVSANKVCNLGNEIKADFTRTNSQIDSQTLIEQSQGATGVQRVWTLRKIEERNECMWELKTSLGVNEQPERPPSETEIRARTFIWATGDLEILIISRYIGRSLEEQRNLEDLDDCRCRW